MVSKRRYKLRAKAVWSDGPAMPQDMYAWMKEHVAESKVAKENADPAAKARGVKRVQAEYRKPFICHASIGPSCALAWMKGDSLEVWSHTQGIFNLRKEIALVLRMPEEKVIVHHGEGAGCYGHNGADDVALDAALIAPVERQAGSTAMDARMNLLRAVRTCHGRGRQPSDEQGQIALAP
jgi:CO/xanthine dehydrogenase Mo-binding subunit